VSAEGITAAPFPVTDVSGLQATLTSLQAQIDALEPGGGGAEIPISNVTGLQAALDDLQDQIDAIDTGGGGGAPVVVASGYVTTGNVAVQNTGGAAALLTGGPTFSSAAAAGDRIRFDWSALLQPGGGTFWDVAVIVAGAAVRYAGTGSGTASVEGDPGAYPDNTYRPRPGPFSFTAEAGDISGGNVTFAIVVRSTNTGAQLYASTSFPLRYTITNYGAAA
jgi:hypothetical protein